ncbi:fimbrillin family protein [Rikenella microfusus]|uniref:fimbrillin family protein n=2 Tax=Rikenella microfusus TaxID=28139 RepID=UPI002356ED25|nr:fimbrillin family protein [Rikenella microfusus]
MKQTILIGLLSAVAVTGCKSEQWVRDDGSVRFAAYRPANAAETKVTGTNFDAGDEIAVFAPLAGNPIHGEYDTQGNGPAKDRRYVADDNNNFAAKTESDKIRYSTTSAKLDFYAVYPAMGPAPRYAVVDRNTYRIDLGNIADQRKAGAVVPYIYSNNAKAKGAGDGVVTLEFRNVFAKIGIDVDYDRGMMGDTLSRVEFYAADGLYRECVIDLTLGDHAAVATNGGREVPATAAEPYYFRPPLKEAARTEGYIVPGTARNPVIRLTFGDPAPAIGTDGGAAPRPKVYLCEIPAESSQVVYEAGKAYTYRITIDSKVEVGIGGTIEEWVAAGGVPPIYAE